MEKKIKKTIHLDSNYNYILRYKELKKHYPNNKKAILRLLTFSNRNWEKYTNKLIIKSIQL